MDFLTDESLFLKSNNPYLMLDKAGDQIVLGIPLEELNHTASIKSRLEDLYYDKKLLGIDEDIEEAILFLENIIQILD